MTAGGVKRQADLGAQRKNLILRQCCDHRSAVVQFNIDHGFRPQPFGQGHMAVQFARRPVGLRRQVLRPDPSFARCPTL